MDRGSGFGSSSGDGQEKDVCLGLTSVDSVAPVAPYAKLVKRSGLSGKVVYIQEVRVQAVGLGNGAKKAIKSLHELSQREQLRVRAEIGKTRGLMPLLMKPRNRQCWSREDKEQLAQHLKRLSALSPYLAVLVLPGGFLVLPAVAWWLDRRRGRARAPVG